MFNLDYSYLNDQYKEAKKEDKYYKEYDNYFKNIFNAYFFSNLN